MSVKLLRSVSVIAISASLAMPAPIHAQSQAETQAAETCPDGSEPIADQNASGALVCPPEAGSDAQADADQQAGAEAATAVKAEAAPDAQGEAEAQQQIEAETPQAEADATTEQAETDAEASPPPVAEAAEEQPQQEASSTQEAETEPQEAAPTVDAAEAEPQEEKPSSEANVGTETTDTAAAGAEGETQATEETAAGAETPPPVDQSGSQATAEAEATETDADSQSETTQDGTAEGAAQTETEQATAAQASGETVSVEVQQDDTEATTAEANQSVAAEAAAESDAEIGAEEADKVETVTEETARRSDEEFATTATAPANRREGLSNFEKFALGALGVAAAATLLKRNEEVVVSSQDRLVVRDDSGNYRVLKNDDELLRRPGVQVATREYSDGSTRTVVTREDGVRVVTIRAADGQVLKRTRILPDGHEIVLFDDTVDVEPVQMSFLEQYRPRERTVDADDPDALRAALQALENPTDRYYSLQQIRQIRAVRELVPEIDLDDVNFETGSAVIRAEEAQDLSAIGRAIAGAIRENPNEVFLIEGHTDAVGGAAMNLALSDRRAESAALALTEYFDIPPENLVVQGYGESNLKIRTNEAERANRRVAVRRITPLLYSQR